jgi:hypothetical protein
MFKYTIVYTLSNGRRVSTVIKTGQDLDINSEMQMFYFAYAYNIVQAMERIWGTGSVQKWKVTEKTQMLQYA